MVADTTPQALLAQAGGPVWSVTTDPATAMRLQATYPVSAVVTQPHGVTVRLVSPTRPHELALPADPTLEDAYLVAIGTPPVAFMAGAG